MHSRQGSDPNPSFTDGNGADAAIGFAEGEEVAVE